MYIVHVYLVIKQNGIHSHLFADVEFKILLKQFLSHIHWQEVKEGRTQINHLATQWYQDVRAVPSESDSDDEAETSLINHTSEVNHHWNRHV